MGESYAKWIARMELVHENNEDLTKIADRIANRIAPPFSGDAVVGKMSVEDIVQAIAANRDEWAKEKDGIQIPSMEIYRLAAIVKRMARGDTWKKISPPDFE